MERRVTNYWCSIIVLVPIFIGALVSSSAAQSHDWWHKLKQVEPGTTTRSEVERLFSPISTIESEGFENNKAEGSWSKIVRYQTRYVRLEATYSTGRCTETKANYAYDIERSVLVQLILRPIEFPKTRSLGLDLRRLRSERVDDMPGAFLYHDDKSGVIVSVYKGSVREVELGLSDVQSALPCSKD